MLRGYMGCTCNVAAEDLRHAQVPEHCCGVCIMAPSQQHSFPHLLLHARPDLTETGHKLVATVGPMPAEGKEVRDNRVRTGF